MYFSSDRVEELAGYEINRLVSGIAQLDEELTIDECGLETEAHIEAACTLDGGKRKRKKKVYTGPKKIKHKHKKRPKAALEYYAVEDSGKIKRLKIESPNCEPGTYMADHPNRHVCGKTGHTFWKLTADGKRLPHPKQNKPQAAAAAGPAAKAAPAKKKGKK